MNNENLLYSLIQNNDIGSLLVAQDLALEMNCGLLIIYQQCYSLISNDGPTYIISGTGINNNKWECIRSCVGIFEWKYAKTGKRCSNSDDCLLRIR